MRPRRSGLKQGGRSWKEKRLLKFETWSLTRFLLWTGLCRLSFVCALSLRPRVRVRVQVQARGRAVVDPGDLNKVRAKWLLILCQGGAVSLCRLESICS